MKKKDIDYFLSVVFPPLKELIREDVAIEVDRYRKGIRTSVDWCCQDMKQFAHRFWGLTSPSHDNCGFSPAYRFEDKPVNWCMFCGAKL